MTISYHAGNRIQGLSTDEATPDFSDEYTTNTGWTQVGTLITVDSGTADKVNFAAPPANADHRVHKSLGVTLSDTLWTAEFEATITFGNNPNGIPFWLSATTVKPRDTGGTNDGVGVWIQKPSSTNQVGMAKADGGVLAVSTMITLPTTICYYRFQRTSATNLTLNVFSDSARTTHITGSPLNYTIGATITGLANLQHSTDDGGGGATDTFTGTLDNTKIWNNTTTPTALASKLPNVVAGSRFEETDTSKVYYKSDVFSFTSTTGTNTFTPSGSFDVQYLVVAGGGGGGYNVGSGGGAGGFRTATSLPVTAQSYSITVGAGGAGATVAGNGAVGLLSTFSTITSDGGGYGAGGVTGGVGGGNGGSGGGAQGYPEGGGTALGGAGTVNQGYAGGAATGAFGAPNAASGGGGGAGAVGGISASAQGGAGGNGVATSITGTSVTYAGGGGGATNGAGAGGVGGSGGGTAGTITGAATNVSANTGGGGGGGATTGGNGGSGIVIIKLTSGSATAVMNSATLTPTTAWSQMS